MSFLKKKKKEKGLIRYFVRDLNRQTNLKLDCLKKRLKITKGLKEASIGRFSIYCTTSSKFKTEANNLLQKNNNYDNIFIPKNWENRVIFK